MQKPTNMTHLNRVAIPADMRQYFGGRASIYAAVKNGRITFAGQTFTVQRMKAGWRVASYMG